MLTCDRIFMKIKNWRLILIVFFVLIIISYLVFLTNVIFDDEEVENVTDVVEYRESDGKFSILYWTKFFKRKDFYYGFGDESFQKCKHKNCFLTANKNLMPVDKFDAVFFHAPNYYDDYYGEKSYPKKRSPHQRYVFVNFEAPLRYLPPKNVRRSFKKFYNWTLTYRSDSDIYFPYGSFNKSGETNYKLPSKTNLQDKKKLVAWFVSNCGSLVTNKRFELAKSLQKLIPIDIYGDCGSLSCPSGEADFCYRMVEKKYKFYLSFENSYCYEYVTEKFFNILQYDVVPIVYGWADYKQIAPPHSFINVEDFESVQDLATYLKFLDDHDKEYVKYLEWKTKYNVMVNYAQQGLCQLCEKLNTDFVPKVYQDIFDWWIKFDGDNKERCKIKKLPNIVDKL